MIDFSVKFDKEKINLWPKWADPKKGAANWDANNPPVKEELTELARLIEYRPGMLQEGLDERNNIEDQYRGIITYDRFTHPNTSKLIGLAQEAATLAVMKYKREYARPRPSQLSPNLMPPVDPPQHAAFPSGHATQAYTLSAVLDCLTNSRLVASHYGEVDPKTGKRVKLKRDPYLEMAERIARNREVMGLHYASDSQAGKELSAHVFKVLRALPGLKDLWKEALAEWRV